MSEASMQSRKICFVEVDEAEQSRFAEALSGYEVIFVHNLAAVPGDTEVLSTFIGERVGPEFLDAHTSLKLIATRSTGCDHIDLDACEERSVFVTNVGNYGENSVAEHTFALILALSRRLKDAEAAVRSGHFSHERLRGFDLRGKTLGVIGAGRVGLHVIRIGIGFGLRVLACDENPHPFFTELLDFEYVPFEELMRRSDIISLHVPLHEKTRHMINRETLKLCKEEILLINTARGGLLDPESIREALDSGRIAGLGLDVLEDESVFHGGVTSLLGEKIVERVRNTSARPVSKEPSAQRLAEFSRLVMHSQLLQRPEVVLTPHIAFNSHEAVEKLSSLTIENISNYLAGKPLQHRCA